MTAEFLEQDVCIGNGLDRCADCERLRILEADGRCSECLTFRTVPVKAHVPMPRYRITVRKGAEIVYGPEDVVQETTVIKIRDWFRDEPFSSDYVFSVDYINSKAGVLR
jgi:hypothetical protein